MAEFSSFEQVLNGLGANSQTAAEAVVRRGYTRVVAAVRRRIGAKYQAKVDAESVANSAMKSFFRRHTGDAFALTDWQDLWNLITRIALNKLGNRIRKYRQAKRAVDREAPYDGQEGQEFLDSPELDAIAADLYERLVRDVAPEERAVLDLSLQGYLVREVAAEIGVSERTVKRIRKEYQRRLEELLED